MTPWRIINRPSPCAPHPPRRRSSLPSLRALSAQFGTLGWNAPYAFNSSDLGASARQLRTLLALHRDAPDAFDHRPANRPPLAGGSFGEATSRFQKIDPSSVPWEALRYVTCELIYGGRITDAHDRRLCDVLLADVYDQKVLSADDTFAFSPSGVYRPPALGASVHAVRAHVTDFPMADAPEIFGLHENADVSCATRETAELFDAALRLHGRAAGNAAADGDHAAAALRVAEEIDARLPPPFDLPAVRSAFPYDYRESLRTVLVQELSRYNRLLAAVRASLEELRAGLGGRVAMSAELDALLSAVRSHKVPAEWRAHGYTSRKPLGAWTADLLARVAFFEGWLSKGQPDEFWLPAFFAPHAFLTAVLQNHARREGVRVDCLRFEHAVLSQLKKKRDPPRYGAHMYGLFLEGASWNVKERTLAEALPSQLFGEMNVIWLKPTTEPPAPADAPTNAYADGDVTDGDAPAGAPIGGAYDCPVYQTTDRHGGFVCTVRLPSAGVPESHWIKRSTALICSLDD